MLTIAHNTNNMKTRTILIGAGIVLGVYVIYRFVKKKQERSLEVEPLDPRSAEALPTHNQGTLNNDPSQVGQ